MIRIIAGGKKHPNWAEEAIREYEKRLRKPFNIEWEFHDEDRLIAKLSNWPFDPARHYVICCDERGRNISSREYSQRLQDAITNGREVIILIGGAYGFTDEIRNKSDFVWSFSNLIFPHAIARLIVTEQTYRAAEIVKGSSYHHG